MRHDEHYVEALAASSGTPIGRLVPIEQVDPNPDQPRQVMGDLSDNEWLKLHEIPVVIRDVDDSELLEIALVENLQRKDLSPFEEAEALHTLKRPRIQTRRTGQATRKVQNFSHRVPQPQRHARRGQRIMSAGRHFI